MHIISEWLTDDSKDKGREGAGQKDSQDDVFNSHESDRVHAWVSTKPHLAAIDAKLTQPFCFALMIGSGVSRNVSDLGL
jgi:hypothetical protein